MPKCSSILNDEGIIYVSGFDTYGQFGCGVTRSQRSVFQAIQNVPAFSSIAASKTNTYAICKDEGSIWLWGDNTKGQCGLGSQTYVPIVSIPTPIPHTRNFISISAGYKFCLAIDNDLHVWGLGRNDSSQLGLGDIMDRKVLTMNPHISDIVAVTSGFAHSLALSSDGRAFGIGVMYGRGSNSYFHRSGYSYNELARVPVHIASKTPVLKIAAGQNHSFIIDSDLVAWGFGSNWFRQLGTLNPGEKPPFKMPVESVVDVWCGEKSSFLMDAWENVWVIGRNDSGQLGIGFASCAQKTPQIAHTLHGKRLLPLGSSLFVFGDDGSLYGCGSNDNGQLGLPTENPVRSLTLIPEVTVSCAPRKSLINSAMSYSQVNSDQ